MSPRTAENQRMSTPNKKFVKSMIILGCNWLTVSKIKKTVGKIGFVGVLWLEGKTLKRLWILIQFAKRSWQMHMNNEYFQNDVIDLRILGDIGSVCIYRFPFLSPYLWGQQIGNSLITRIKLWKHKGKERCPPPPPPGKGAFESPSTSVGQFDF